MSAARLDERACSLQARVSLWGFQAAPAGLAAPAIASQYAGQDAGRCAAATRCGLGALAPPPSTRRRRRPPPLLPQHSTCHARLPIRTHCRSPS